MTMRAATGAGEIEVGALLSEAWRAFQQNASAFMGGITLSLLVLVPPVALAYFVMYQQKQGQLDPALSLALEWALGALTAAATQWIYAGLLRMSLIAIRGGEVSASDIFRGGQHFVPVLVAGLLVQGLTGVGVMLCVIPGILWALSSVLAPYFVIDHGIPVFAAIRASFAATSGLRGQVFVVWIVSAILLVAGALLMLVGLLVTFPLNVLLMAAFYERVWASARPSA